MILSVGQAIVVDNLSEYESEYSTNALNLESVKRVAEQKGWNQISFSQTSRVISFRKSIDGKSVRINVYWTTGTVGTCLDHPRMGKTQLFRRNVDYPTLHQIFENPRAHTGSGYYKKENDPQSFDQCQDLENEVKLQMMRLDQELEYMKMEKAKMQEILNAFEEERERERKRIAEEAEKAEREKKRKAQEEADAERERLAEQMRLEKLRKQQELDLERHNRGKYITFSLYESDHVMECFDQTVTSMACGGRATIFLYENGGWAFTSGLPKLLHNKLNGRQITLPSPTYVSIGSMDRYFIQFEDGKFEYVGCDAMNELLQNDSRTVKTVAFGEEWDSYFVVFTDGGYRGQSFPSALGDLLIKRKRRGDLTCVSLGPNGEYYMSARNGRCWWGGISNDNISTINSVCDGVQFIDFGDDDTFFTTKFDATKTPDTSKWRVILPPPDIVWHRLKSIYSTSNK